MNSDVWTEYRRQQNQRRKKRLPHRIELLYKICGTLNLKVEKKTEYQYRISNDERSIDIYPIHYRWHDITTNKRGQVKGDGGLKELLILKLIKQ
jgi:hypothetical protein